MATVISVNVQKGGCGKTTTTLMLGYFLAQKGYKVLMIDFDSQGNLSYAARGGENIYAHHKHTSFEAVKEGSVAPYVIPALHSDGSEIDGLFLVPAEDWLSELPRWIYTEYIKTTTVSPMYLLRTALDTVKDEFDFVLIDCPPSPGEPTRLALVAADWSLIIMQSQIFCYDAVSRFIEIIGGAQKHFNPNLGILGVVPSLLDARTKLDIGIIEQARADYGDAVMNTMIRSKSKIKEIAIGIPSKMNKEFSMAIEQYMDLTKEVLERCQK